MVRTHSSPVQKLISQPNVQQLLRELQREHPKLAPYNGEDKVKEFKFQWRPKVTAMKYRFGKDNSRIVTELQNRIKSAKENKRNSEGFKFTEKTSIVSHKKEDSNPLRNVESNLSVSPKCPIENHVRRYSTSRTPKDEEIRIPELDSDLVARLLKDISLVSK